MKRISVKSKQEVQNHIETILKSINTTVNEIRTSTKDPLKLFYEMKFSQIGKDPLENRSLNVIEQINQTYTYLVSLKAVEYLYEHYNFQGEYLLNLGNVSGFDIQSEDGNIIAEVFAATSVNSNQKLKKDIEKLKGFSNKRKFVFYYTPEDESRVVENYRNNNPDVNIIRVEI